ncbi:MAG: tyrosine--tRNA ligase [Alphaproteobacteria bacterium]
MKSEFLNTLEQRGFIHQATDLEGLDAYLAKTPDAKAYIGFDCTAPTLHVGSLVQIMMLRHFQAAGHTPIALMGGGTTKVGDPSGKTEVRKILNHADIDLNVAGIKTIFDHFLDFEKDRAILVDNADWLDALDYIPFLREVGKHFTVNKMLTMESVKMRLDREQPLTFLEFNYMILQAYDFVELYKRFGCKVQLGGSDQWGNIVNGIDLGRRMENAELFGLTSPLITTSDGEKMGKTAKGAVWLTAEDLSDYDYWQFWRNTQDSDVGRFLKLFTDLPLDEIARLEALKGQELNQAKKVLADAATGLCRGNEAAKAASETARKTFEEGKSGADLPIVEMKKADLEAGISILDLFIDAGLCTSKKEARRLIQQGGAKLDDQAISDENLTVNSGMLGKDGQLKLSAGKKRHAVLKVR